MPLPTAVRLVPVPNSSLLLEEIAVYEALKELVHAVAGAARERLPAEPCLEPDARRT